MAQGSNVRFSAGQLTRIARDILAAAGLSAADAGVVADTLVWADLRGVGSHGVARLPRYLKMIEAGDMNPRPTIRLASDTPVIAIVEADRAPGPVAMTFGMRAAIERAKKSGVGIALVRATTHTAALGYYTESATKSGMVAIALAASGPTMAYHGASAAGVSTSPVSIAAPGGASGPIVFDMGTGVVSLGRLAQAARQGDPLPEGWALDKQGAPTIDPKAAVTPLPLGGPKGSGLALMIEIAISLLAGNPILARALDGGAEDKRHRQNGLILAFDIASFCDPDWFAAEVARLRSTLKSLPRSRSDAPILMPGERGAQAREERLRAGVPLPSRVAEELLALAGKHSVRVDQTPVPAEIAGDDGRQ